jgi:ParD-like antitoxin of type II ParDE toxin-antitoxin system
MGQPVKLSDNLVLEARKTGEIMNRSIARQIEFWAGLGRAIEPLLRSKEVQRLRELGTAKDLWESIREADSPEGRERLAKHLQQLPFPHFEPVAGRPGVFVKIEEDGTRVLGRVVKRQFVPTE